MIVYLITNLVNGKQYVGQTTQPLKRRWDFHVSKGSRCLALKFAIEKYGKENFQIEELMRCETLEELDRIESTKIAELNTLAPNGYNLTTGGERPIFSDETRDKMSQSRKGVEPWNKGLTVDDPRVAANVDKMSEGKNRVFKYFGPRKVTKTSAEALVNLRNASSKRCIKIICNETGQIFESIKEAALALNARGGNISKQLRGQTPTVRGYTFAKVSE